MPQSVKLVGILNITPDSFSDGGKYLDPKDAVVQARRLFADGADLIDVGAESTNPWSSPLNPKEEWRRLEPVLTILVKDYPGKISVDTYHPETAKKALELGVDIINDVTMFKNPAMTGLASKYGGKARYIVSHLSLKVKSIADAHRTMPTHSVQEVKDELLDKIKELTEHGVPKQNIILDPGIGFGKIPELNEQLLDFVKGVPGFNVMVGYSRKRFLGEHRMEVEPNLEAAKTAIAAGTKYLRVHDVLAHKHLLENM